MATHSSILSWEISWTEEPGRLQSMGSQTVRHDLLTEHSDNTFLFKKKNVKCMCLSNELIETLNFSLVWKTTLGLHHSLIKRKLLLRKWIVIYLNSDALGIDRKIWLWLTKAMKKRIPGIFQFLCNGSLVIETLAYVNPQAWDNGKMD